MFLHRFDGLYQTRGVNARLVEIFCLHGFSSLYPFALLKAAASHFTGRWLFPGGDLGFVPDKKCRVPPG